MQPTERIRRSQISAPLPASLATSAASDIRNVRESAAAKAGSTALSGLSRLNHSIRRIASTASTADTTHWIDDEAAVAAASAIAPSRPSAVVSRSLGLTMPSHPEFAYSPPDRHREVRLSSPHHCQMILPRRRHAIPPTKDVLLQSPPRSVYAILPYPLSGSCR